MSRKKWTVSSLDKELAADIASEYNIDPFTALLLVSRNITDEGEIEEFFSSDAVLSDPFEIKDMDKACSCINSAIENGKKIAVYGDYDADGVTSTALLYLFLEMNGADVVTYIPDRNSEGYGLNCGAIDKLHEQGVKLIVTVDNGISAIKEAEYINSLGMELVITDHHQVGKVLPKAVAVVDPHREDSLTDFKMWAGVGVAFKLVCALCDGESEDVLSDYADIVAIGTIGDIVPLTGENRSIVKRGIKLINEGCHCGIDALKNVAGIKEKSLSATGIAFSLVPRINACGRMSKADDALSLLISDDFSSSVNLANEIDSANQSRQKTEQMITAEAEKQLLENPQMLYERVLIFEGEGWHGGVIGIVASRFVERYGKPCIVITVDEKEAKGSGRSIDGFSLYDAISSASPLLTHFGGHVLAAGFGMKKENLPAFKKAINDYAKTVEMPYLTMNIDCRLKPEFISSDILETITALEPFGAGNPQPIFGLYSMRINAVQSIGNGKHIRLNLSKNGANLQALKFGTSADNFPYVPGDIVDLAVRLEKNEYMGQVKVSIYIKDIRMSQTDDMKYLKSMRLYEKIKRKERLTKAEADFALPERKLIANVFRFIRDNGGWKFDSDVLCYRLGDNGSGICKILSAVDILTELDIFEKENMEIRLKSSVIKVNLEDSELIKYLKSFI